MLVLKIVENTREMRFSVFWQLPLQLMLAETAFGLIALLLASERYRREARVCLERALSRIGSDRVKGMDADATGGAAGNGQRTSANSSVNVQHSKTAPSETSQKPTNTALTPPYFESLND